MTKTLLVLLLLTGCAVTGKPTTSDTIVKAPGKPTITMPVCSADAVGGPRILKQFKADDFDFNIYRVRCYEA